MRQRVQHSLLRYGYGVLAVVIALGVARLLQPFDLEGFLFVIAVAIAVWFGGRGPGVVAIALSIVVLNYFFVAPLSTGSNLQTYVYFVVFGVLAVLVTALSEGRHRTERSLTRSRDELEVEVQTRTAELRKVNADLERALADATKSQHQLRLVLDTIPGMVWSGLPDGSFDFVNEPWLRYLGCSWEELAARGGLVSAVHSDDVEESIKRWRTTRATGRHTDHELRMRRADGQDPWFLTRAFPLRDESGDIIRWYGTATDIEDRKHAEMRFAGEKQLLELIARGEPLARSLEAMCRLVEDLASGSLSSILLLDPNANRLRHGAAPSLPAHYVAAIDGIGIGPSVGSCGTAAYRAEPVIVSDIRHDPLWAEFRDLALGSGLHACWSTPILSSAGKVLGTFAIYYREPRSPNADEHALVRQITHLASIAIERAHSSEALHDQASLLDLTHDTIFVRDADDIITYWNHGAEELYGWNRHDALGKVTHTLLQTTFPAPLPDIQRNYSAPGAGKEN